MTILSANIKWRRASGILLVECVTYFAIFAILVGIGTAAFYLCWDQSKAMVYATDDIGAALRAGERWRQDVRNAGGKISVEQSADGERVRMPGAKGAVVYRFESGEVRRELAEGKISQLLLPRVNTSQMTEEARGAVTAWRWELNVVVRRPETHQPLFFTFEAAQKQP